MTYKIWEKWTNLGNERDNSEVKRRVVIRAATHP